MPFVRFSRDRRGYEHTYLIHALSKKGSPTKILYWYRTPPGVKVGRVAFDDVVRRTLEAQYPGVMFDWQKFAETPIPPVEVEHWRERRRSERAAKQARLAAARDDQEDAGLPNPEMSADGGEEADEVSVSADPGEATALETLEGDEPADEETVDDSGPVAASEMADPGRPVSEGAEASPAAASTRRRRRRGGRRRKRGSGTPDPTPNPTE